MVSDEMISRGPWTPEKAEQLVKGFYKFGQYGDYTREAHERRVEVDPGLPDWDELQSLLTASPLKVCLRPS